MGGEGLKGRVAFQSCPLCAGPHAELRRDDCTTHPLWQDVIGPELVWYFTDEAARVIFAQTQECQQIGYMVEDSRPVCGRLVERVPVKSGTWLDVGFGSGALMFAAEEAGFTVEGVDVRADLADTMDRLGYNVRQGELHHLEPVQRDVISLCDVIEHVPFPGDLLAEARARGRVLLLSCPNAGSMAWRALSGAGENPYWREIEHFHNFTRERLYGLLRETGWEPLSYSVSERYRLGMEIVAE